MTTSNRKIRVTEDDIRFLRLFPSNEVSFVKRTKVAAAPRADGKHEADYSTVPLAVGVTDVQAHLAGRVCIVAKPVKLDRTCHWGAIDIDVYDDETFVKLQAAAAAMPLNFFRSKSGGPHAYAFFDPPQFAAEVRWHLAEWAAQLGYPGAEIFPAQNQIDAGNLGLGIALPFFGDAARFAKFVPKYYAPNGSAPHTALPPTSNKEFLGVRIPPGVNLQAVLETKLNVNVRKVGYETYFDYHALRGLQGTPQPCLIQGSIHQVECRNPRQCSFVMKDGRFYHTCFDSDCRAVGQAPSGRGAEDMEAADSTSKTRIAIRKLGLEHILLGESASAATMALEWPAPEALGDDLPTVPAFDLTMLPDSLRGMVEDTSDRMQSPPDFAAAAAIVALAGVVGRRARVQPKEQDSGWQVIPNLWGLNVAPPGFLKSPVLAAVTAPLAHVEEMWRNNHAGEVATYEAEKEKKELAHQAWREMYKKAFKNEETPPVEPDISLLEPTIKRLLLTDSTPEKLQEILSENPAGVLVLRDELIGLIAEMDKEGREQQRAFYLQAWNGYGGYTVDRIARGTLHIPHVCLSVFGNVQPARLHSYLTNLLEGGPGDDGLFQRFQILVWPDPPREWKLIDRPPNNAAIARAERMYSTLANLPTDAVRMRFTPDAQQYFFYWWTALEEKVRSGVGMHPSLVSHLSKYRSLMPSLAALYELADVAADGTRPEEELKISKEHTFQAGEMCSYLEQHARRVYSCIVAPQIHAARELARHIERGAVPEEFPLREIYRRGWAALDTPDRVTEALKVLEDAGWVRRIRIGPSAVGGRPAERWTLNPAIKREQ